MNNRRDKPFDIFDVQKHIEETDWREALLAVSSLAAGISLGFWIISLLG